MSDYDLFLLENGLTEQQMITAKQTLPALSPTPKEWENKIMVRPSCIEGVGIFTTASISAGEDIGPAWLAGQWTETGRYANHAQEPNVSFLPSGHFQALKPIEAGQEITVNYRQVKQVNHTKP